MARRVLLMLYVFFLPLAVQADVSLSDKWISVSVDGLGDLRKRLTNRVVTVIVENLNKETDTLDNAIECRELKELRSAYVCMSFFQQDLNDAFTRMGIFLGAGKDIKAGTLLNNDAHLLVNYKKLVAGHNLPGKVIETFFQSALKSAVELGPFERMFLQGFVQHPRIQKHKGNYYVIGVSVQSTKPPLKVLSHEIHHAQFALTSGYKAVVEHFWNSKVSKQDQAAIKAKLGRVYNLNQNILLDEFQAYLVQAEADQDMLRPFVSGYQSALLKAFADAGITLVKVAH